MRSAQISLDDAANLYEIDITPALRVLALSRNFLDAGRSKKLARSWCRTWVGWIGSGRMRLRQLGDIQNKGLSRFTKGIVLATNDEMAVHAADAPYGGETRHVVPPELWVQRELHLEVPFLERFGLSAGRSLILDEERPRDSTQTAVHAFSH